MRWPQWRLTLVLALFVGWLLCLGYLAAISQDRVILSRPQLLASDLYLVAEVSGDASAPLAEVVVHEVYPEGAAPQLVPQTRLVLANLPQVGREQGWRGPGLYILPVQRKQEQGQEKYLLTPIPPSPGFPLEAGAEVHRFLRLYPASAGTRRQLQQWLQLRHKEHAQP
jgi:hypothetical protein